jgi:hypothetical protein
MTTLKSSNGWPASMVQEDIKIKIYTIVSASKNALPVRLRCAETVAPLLIAACKEWHRTVEKLENGEVQGYMYRDVRGGNGTLSNHSSGTAIDFWPSRHPQGDKDGNYTKAQQARILAICKKYGLRSGGTYKTAKTDWQHVEINLPPAKVAALIKELGLKI